MVIIALEVETLELDLTKEALGLLEWFNNYFLRLSNLFEVALLVGFFFISLLLNKRFKLKVEELLIKVPGLKLSRAKRLIREVLLAWLVWVLVWMYVLLATPLGMPYTVMTIVGNLLTAWVLIDVISILLPGESNIIKFFSYLVWSIVVLNILDLYQPVLEILDNIVIAGGNISLSLLAIIRGAIIFTILFWLSGRLHTLLKDQVQQRTDLTPSIKLLIFKTARVALITLVVLITLSSLGVELSAFAFLGGAIGVGVGFGLQKIVSNYVSGIIILLDRSIKPGDIIEIDDIFGEVRSQETRFASVVTLSGKEYLVPNESFITQQVINWSYSDNKVRIDVPVGVAYKSDLRLVERLILAAMNSVDRVLAKPAANCILKEFGDNTVNFELRFWIDDPGEGVYNVRSDVLFAVWDNFAERDIEIAFPQRDLHLESISKEASAEIKSFVNKRST